MFRGIQQKPVSFFEFLYDKLCVCWWYGQSGDGVGDSDARAVMTIDGVNLSPGFWQKHHSRFPPKSDKYLRPKQAGGKLCR